MKKIGKGTVSKFLIVLLTSGVLQLNGGMVKGIVMDGTYLVDARVKIVDDEAKRTVATVRTGDYGKFSAEIPDGIEKIRISVTNGRVDADGRMKTLYDSLPQHDYVTGYYDLNKSKGKRLVVSNISKGLWRYRKKNPEGYEAALAKLPIRIRAIFPASNNLSKVERVHRLLDRWIGKNVICLELSDNGLLDGSRYKHLTATLVNRLLAPSRPLQDRGLDICVRMALKKQGVKVGLTGKLSATQLKKLRSLECSDRGVKSLKGITRLKNLKRLTLSGNGLRDISDLKRHSALEYLDISYNYLEDISPLANIATLKNVIVPDNCIRDFSAVESGIPALFGKMFQNACRLRSEVEIYDFSGKWEKEKLQIHFRAYSPRFGCRLKFGDGKSRKVRADALSHEILHRYADRQDAEKATLICAPVKKRIRLEHENNATVRLKKTGQIKSYDDNGNEVKRCAVRDDGCYQTGVDPRYSRDDAAGIVTDHVTGLQWQDAAAPVSKPWLTEENYDKCKDGDETACYDTSGDTAASYCAALSLGGHDDWRLPTAKEFDSLVHYGRYSPAIDPVFRYTDSSDYWSSTTLADSIRNAWFFDFNDGHRMDSYKGFACYIRCVRSMQSLRAENIK